MLSYCLKLITVYTKDLVDEVPQFVLYNNRLWEWIDEYESSLKKAGIWCPYPFQKFENVTEKWELRLIAHSQGDTPTLQMAWVNHSNEAYHLGNACFDESGLLLQKCNHFPGISMHTVYI